MSAVGEIPILGHLLKRLGGEGGKGGGGEVLGLGGEVQGRKGGLEGV